MKQCGLQTQDTGAVTMPRVCMNLDGISGPQDSTVQDEAFLQITY